MVPLGGRVAESGARKENRSMNRLARPRSAPRSGSRPARRPKPRASGLTSADATAPAGRRSPPAPAPASRRPGELRAALAGPARTEQGAGARRRSAPRRDAHLLRPPRRRAGRRAVAGRRVLHDDPRARAQRARQAHRHALRPQRRRQGLQHEGGASGSSTGSRRAPAVFGKVAQQQIATARRHLRSRRERRLRPHVSQRAQLDRRGLRRKGLRGGVPRPQAGRDPGRRGAPRARRA